jgi:hypothetical protein
MEMALSARKPEAAQLVATECVLEAETKDHLNWELIGQLAKKIKGAEGKALKEAHEKVEEEEDEHLYHTTRLDARALERGARASCGAPAA